MLSRFSIALFAVISVASGAGSLSLSAQGSNPLVGGVWDRYSFKNAQGVESGTPGAFFLYFTADGHFIINSVPRGKEKAPKPIKDMTKEELVSHLQGIGIRRGTYTISGSGNGFYHLVLTDDASPFTLDVQGSCPAASNCQITMENGEVHLKDEHTGNQTRWRRVTK